MITKWMVRNFKSIRHPTELELAPLTIFAGANSSGKSTLIQSILLVAQTLAHKLSSRSLVLNGSFSRLGQFNDIRSEGSESNTIDFAWTCAPLRSAGTNPILATQFNSEQFSYGVEQSRLGSVDCSISFDGGSSTNDGELFQVQPRLLSTTMVSQLSTETHYERSSILIKKADSETTKFIDKRNYAEYDKTIETALQYDVELDNNFSLAEVREEFRSAEAAGCKLSHFLPDYIIYDLDIIEETASAITEALQFEIRRIPSELRRQVASEAVLTSRVLKVISDVLKEVVSVQEFLEKSEISSSELMEKRQAATLTDFLAWLRSLSARRRLQAQLALRSCNDLFEQIHIAMRGPASLPPGPRAYLPKKPPSSLAQAISYMDHYFTACVKYLGPLRDSPRSLYPLTPTADPHDVGVKGENTASILELHRNEIITYVPSLSMSKPDAWNFAVEATLESAVSDWLNYLEIAQLAVSRDFGQLGYELRVRSRASLEYHDLTHVGVGVSQVIPILTMCLLANADTTLIVEQPELHLHPKVQCLLGDFFLSMAFCNKQCIIETHSEHLVDRLRFRIAEAERGSAVLSKIKMYFVEKESVGSTFKEVQINEYGAIPNWPTGFFDVSQQQAENILRAAILKKRSQNRIPSPHD